jgi:hypothetical protein
MVDLLTPQLVGWLTLLSSLVSPENPKEGPRVKVTVVVIHAHDRWDQIDPRLKLIAAEVQKCQRELKAFTLASITTKSLAVNEKALFPIHGDKNAVVVVHQAADKSNKVCLAVTPPQQGEIVYRTVCGKYLPIVTRCQSCEQILPVYVARAVATAGSPVSTAPALAGCIAVGGKARERLILAIRVQPCNGK